MRTFYRFIWRAADLPYNKCNAQGVRCNRMLLYNIVRLYESRQLANRYKRLIISIAKDVLRVYSYQIRSTSSELVWNRKPHVSLFLQLWNYDAYYLVSFKVRQVRLKRLNILNYFQKLHFYCTQSLVMYSYQKCGIVCIARRNTKTLDFKEKLKLVFNSW